MECRPVLDKTAHLWESPRKKSKRRLIDMSILETILIILEIIYTIIKILKEID